MAFGDKVRISSRADAFVFLPYGDSMINSLSDVIFASLGFVVASLLPKNRFWLL